MTEKSEILRIWEKMRTKYIRSRRACEENHWAEREDSMPGRVQKVLVYRLSLKAHTQIDTLGERFENVK